MKSLRDYLDLLESAGLTDTDVLTDTIQRYRENIAMMPKEEYKGKFEEYILDIDTQHLDGERIIYQFENGYGASVIRNLYSYGGPQGKYELGLMRNGHLEYNNVLNDSNDPIYGYLTWVDVLELLEQIKNLPEKGA